LEILVPFDKYLKTICFIWSSNRFDNSFPNELVVVTNDGYCLEYAITCCCLKKIIEMEEIQDNIIKLDNNIPKDNFIFLVPNKLLW